MLHLATEFGLIKTVELLIKNKADANAIFSDGMTSLLTASYLGHTKIVKILIAANADVSAKNKNGATPIYFASLKGHAEIIEMLLKARCFKRNLRPGGRLRPELVSLHLPETNHCHCFGAL